MASRRWRAFQTAKVQTPMAQTWREMRISPISTYARFMLPSATLVLCLVFFCDLALIGTRFGQQEVPIVVSTLLGVFTSGSY